MVHMVILVMRVARESAGANPDPPPTKGTEEYVLLSRPPPEAANVPDRTESPANPEGGQSSILERLTFPRGSCGGSA